MHDKSESKAAFLTAAPGIRADDHAQSRDQVLLLVTHIRLFLEGLAQALAARPERFIVLTASSESEAAASLRSRSIDTLLVDMAMPDGTAIIRAAGDLSASTAVLALAVEERDQDILACARAGATGYVSRESSLEDLVASIRHANRGELLCSPRAAASLFRQVGVLGDGRSETGSALTARELEVVQLIRLGMANKQIAGRLSIEVATVKNHVHNILEKLRVSGRHEIAARSASIRPEWESVYPASVNR